METRRVRFDKIPQDLRSLNNWILWKLEEVPGKKKLNKTPYSAGGYKANTTDPKTWSHFQEIGNIYKANGKGYSGIGFVFSKEAGIVGIDFDGCIDEYGKIKEDIQRWVDKFPGCYIEKSQSGEGLHIICKGHIPGERRKNPKLNIEIYEEGRYFAITGNVIDDSHTGIIDCQEAINDFYKAIFPPEEKKQPQFSYTPGNGSTDDIISLCSKAKNGHKFMSLFRGDWKSYYQSQSEGDMALCNMIAFYTQDMGQIDSIFRQSGLMRNKWDEKHGEDTYGNMTIRKALSGLREVYHPPGLRTRPSKLVPGMEEALAVETPPLPPEPDGGKKQKKEKENVALKIFEAIKDRDDIKTAWDGENLYILNKRRKWADTSDTLGEMELISKIYDVTGKAGLSKETLGNIKQLLTMKHYKEDKKSPNFHKRTASHEGSLIYSGGDFTVKVRPGAWTVGAHEDLFLEIKNQIQQVKPDVDYKEKNLPYLLKDLMPSKTKEDLILLSIYIASLFIPEIPRPALYIEGDGGSGKTLFAKLVKDIYDPAKVKQTNSISTEDLCLNFTQNDFFVLNNLSKVSNSLSDTLCCIIDGETISKRKLFKDGELFISEAKGTFAITSISTGKKNADLLDRMLKISLQRIATEDRQTEGNIGKNLQEKKPQILAAIFNLISEAMGYMPQIKKEEILEFRLADWYLWGVAIARALNEESLFKELISIQKRLIIEDQLQEDEKIEALYSYLKENLPEAGYLTYPLKEWKQELGGSGDLFKKGNIGSFFKRARSTFQELGYKLENSRTGKIRNWKVTKICQIPSHVEKTSKINTLEVAEIGGSFSKKIVSPKETLTTEEFKNPCDRMTENCSYLEEKEKKKNNISVDMSDSEVKNISPYKVDINFCHSVTNTEKSNNDNTPSSDGILGQKDPLKEHIEKGSDTNIFQGDRISDGILEKKDPPENSKVQCSSCGFFLPGTGGRNGAGKCSVKDKEVSGFVPRECSEWQVYEEDLVEVPF